MNTETVPDQLVNDEALSRDEVYTSLMHGLNAGLPAPQQLLFHKESVSIDLDSIAELTQWQAWFGIERRTGGQPHPSLSEPAEMTRWLASTHARWRGWLLTLHANDPITSEQIADWVATGSAARHAEHEAKAAAAAAMEAQHSEALDEDNQRAKAAIDADLRIGELGRITNPNLARFLAEKENASHGQVLVEVLHMQLRHGDTPCGLRLGEYRDGAGTANQAAVTCKTCIDEMPF